MSIALISILGAVLIPTVRGKLQDGYENALVLEFSDLATAIAAYRQDVGYYPPYLDYLTAIPTAPTDFCGRLLTAADSAKWRGPYTSRIISPQNYEVFQKDTVQDQLVRPGGNPSIIEVQIYGPDTTTAHNVDLKIDGVVNQTGGTMLWSVNGNGTIMSYAIPTRSGAC